MGPKRVPTEEGIKTDFSPDDHDDDLAFSLSLSLSHRPIFE